MSDLGQQIGDRRRELGLTQEQLADKLGSDQAHVSAWECGRTQPRSSTLLAIADALGCDVRLVPREAS